MAWEQEAKIKARNIETSPVNMKCSFLQGATFPDENKIVVGLTARGKDADKFWVSLFYELVHIVLGHAGQTNGTLDGDEKAADDVFPEVDVIEPEPVKCLLSR